MESKSSRSAGVSAVMMKLQLFILFCVSGAAWAESGSSSKAMYEVLNRLEQLQVEMQQLRGQVEEQSYTIEQFKKRQNNIYSDFDQRLQVIEGGAVPAAGINQEMGIEQDTVINDPRNQQVVNYSTPQPEYPAGAKAANSEKQIYQEAYDQLRNGHYSQAIVMFSQLIVDYPDGEYADNAHYWLGEAYNVNRDFNSASEAFQKVVVNYPDSPKVPDALLKLGYLELEQNNIPKGRKYLNEVSLRFPGTPAANLADEKLKLLDKK